MSATSQHEFHPDAESLSAFAEQALGERERGDVLKHLAVCGRCRRVVALAQDAAEAEVAPADAARRVVIQPNAWWKRWRFVWVPTAVVAASAVASISVYIRQAEQHEMAIRIAEQTATQSVTMASNPPPQERPEAAPLPAPPAAATPAVKAAKAAPSGAAPGTRSYAPVATAAMPPPAEPMDRLESAHEPPAPASGARAQGLSGEEFTAAGTPSVYKTPAAAWQEEQNLPERQKQQAEAARNRLLAARATAAASEHGSESGTGSSAPGSSSEQVVVSAPQLKMRAPNASFGALEHPRPAVTVAGAASAIHLPSGLTAVSTASAHDHLLAIDQAGALFLSEDQGSTWERVPRQWTGRAEVVRTQSTENANPEAAPAAEGGGSAPAGAGAAQQPAIVFEIVNDKSQVWLSTDGRIWIAK